MLALLDDDSCGLPTSGLGPASHCAHVLVFFVSYLASIILCMASLLTKARSLSEALALSEKAESSSSASRKKEKGCLLPPLPVVRDQLEKSVVIALAILSLSSLKSMRIPSTLCTDEEGEGEEEEEEFDDDKEE